MKNKTLKEIYEVEKTKPTACQAWVTEVARLTKRTEQTVRWWLSGMQIPDDLTKEVLGKHFGVNPDTLFPVK